MDTLTERCPWCDSLISRTKFLDIQTRIRQEEQKQFKELETGLRKELTNKFTKDLAANKLSLEKTIRAQEEQRIAVLVAEKTQTLQKLKALENNQASFKQQVMEEANRKVTTLSEQAKKQLEQELRKQRELMQKDRDQALLKKQAETNRERETYQKKLKELERKLESKTANEIGDGAELDLFEVLREQFPHDRILRISKGQIGADIHHHVLYKGESCGLLIIDSKNRQIWQNVYVSKLRQDQIEAKAEHAILSTSVFPRGKKELWMDSGIIIISPARVVEIVELLRGAMVKMRILGLSLNQRATKVEKLYKLITSEVYAQRFREAGKLTNDILDLDVSEQKDHQLVWKKRGTLAIRLKSVLREIDADISAIVEADEVGLMSDSLIGVSA
jgi:hypothetical protein